MLSNEEINNATIQTKPIYQSLITNVFEKQLKEIIEQRDVLSERYIKLQELQQQLQMILNKKELTTLVDVGSHFYVKGHIPNTETIFVDVGLGFLSPFTIPDALKFVNKQLDDLNDLIERYKQKALIIEYNIHLALTNNGIQ